MDSLQPLHIQITGRAASGKTTLALLIQKFLEGTGFDVDLLPDDFESVEHLINVETTLGQRVAGMRGKRIVIEMVQAKRTDSLLDRITT